MDLMSKEVLLRLVKSNDPKEVMLFDGDFPHQLNFINDPARLKALFCTRRAAKSFTAGLYMIKEALENPGVNCLFIGLTRLSAEGIIWKDVLKVLDRKHNLNIQFNQSKLTATFQNGSVIWLAGVDTDEDEMNKLLGKKYRLVCLDEASLYTINLQMLIYGILKPAVADNRGTICMMGTSSNITRGLFFDITTGKEPGWSLHTWTANDNPHIRVQWAEELEEIRTLRPLFMQTTLFKQWYLNQWVVDTDKLVYKFNEDRNIYDAFPHRSIGRWTYLLGVDLGYHPDPSAFALCAFNEHDKHLYFLETSKRTEMDITDVANKIKEYQSRFDISRVIIDGANKQAVEEIQKRHNIALTTADKTGKADFIEIMNAEFIQANIKLNKNACSELIEEYKGLVWETEADKIKWPRKEHGSLPNHICDAALYAWRYCYQWLSSAAPVNKDAINQWAEISRGMAEDHLEKQIKEQEHNEKVADIWAISEMGMDDNPLSHYLNKKRQR
jgi:PBSX family phage terminase large subunit